MVREAVLLVEAPGVDVALVDVDLNLAAASFARLVEDEPYYVTAEALDAPLGADVHLVQGGDRPVVIRRRAERDERESLGLRRLGENGVRVLPAEHQRQPAAQVRQLGYPRVELHVEPRQHLSDRAGVGRDGLSDGHDLDCAGGTTPLSLLRRYLSTDRQRPYSPSSTPMGTPSGSEVSL